MRAKSCEDESVYVDTMRLRIGNKWKQRTAARKMEEKHKRKIAPQASRTGFEARVETPDHRASAVEDPKA